MRAAVVYQAQDMRVEERPDPTPREDEVLVKVGKVGVCGSDVHYWHAGALGANQIKEPIILGHEVAGEVVGLGPGVERLAVGDRVVMEPGVPCGKCQFCREGRYNTCQHMHFMATPPVNGCLCDYVAWPEAWCYPMPEGMTYAEGAMIEPTAVAVFSVDLAEMNTGYSVAILGSASIGLLTLQCARVAGAGKVIVTDVIPTRLDWAKRLGADVAIDARADDVPVRVKDETDGMGADVVFEAAGTAVTTQQAVDVVKPGGVIVVIGICQQDVIPMNFGNARRREATLKFVRRYRHVFGRSIDMIARGHIDARSLVTHNFPFDRITDAFQLAKDARDNVLKATVQVGEGMD